MSTTPRRRNGAVKGQVTLAETEKRKVTEGIGGLDNKLESARSALEATRRVLAEAECDVARPWFAGIVVLMQAPLLVRQKINEPADCDTVAMAVREELTSRIDGLGKRYLNQNTIRDIAGFQSQLNKQAELIRDRMSVINSSLVDVEYNPGRFYPAGGSADAGHRYPRLQDRPACVYR
jgi:hypothetical protein